MVVLYTGLTPLENIMASRVSSYTQLRAYCMNRVKIFSAIYFVCILSACGGGGSGSSTTPDPVPVPDPTPSPIPIVTQPAQPVDPQATPEAIALLTQLRTLKGEAFLFGHQDSLAYGVNWFNEPDRSDIKDVSGDYPALYGWELGDLELGEAENLDGVNFRDMQAWIKEAYSRGGVITFSWHMNHPGTLQNAWNTSTGAASLLPGGEHHQALKDSLDYFADFMNELAVNHGDGVARPIPIIFRPWHEHNGSWFWWGKYITNESDYVQLWRFTQSYLRDEKQVHNLLYAFSPDRSQTNLDNFESSYLYAYPGDEYVDILGIDNYFDFQPDSGSSLITRQTNFSRSLASLVDLANKKGKLAAMTEGGQEAIPEKNFWTDRLLAGILANEKSRQIVYAMVWRNANYLRESRYHFYGPYSGHHDENDFVEFYQDEATLFENDLPNMYILPE